MSVLHTAHAVGSLVSAAGAGTDDVKGFGHDAVWVVIVKAVLIFVILVVLTLFNIWFERRVVARMQDRVGVRDHQGGRLRGCRRSAWPARRRSNHPSRRR